ncbi:hypothetical protein GF327_03730 [Candidatus Woesearchaeota archaeon]|nr:hypothetical protein [Candidatus Woesearchaeota archaeon]
MILIKMLGILDALCALVLVFSNFFLIREIYFFLIGSYLLFKGVVFTILSKDPASILDILCGLYALSITLSIENGIVTTLVILYLGQKAAFSFIRF